MILFCHLYILYVFFSVLIILILGEAVWLAWRAVVGAEGLPGGDRPPVLQPRLLRVRRQDPTSSREHIKKITLLTKIITFERKTWNVFFFLS